MIKDIGGVGSYVAGAEEAGRHVPMWHHWNRKYHRAQWQEPASSSHGLWPEPASSSSWQGPAAEWNWRQWSCEEWTWGEEGCNPYGFWPEG